MTGTAIHDSRVAAEPIAIVGSACRFPGGATSPSKLWDLLRDPRDVLTEIPNSRFNANAFYHPDGSHHGTSNVRHSYVLSEDHRLFDAQFFGTKPVEANSIDPQQRLLLETVYESLESAGIPMEKLQGSDTGVYVGLMTNDYADLLGRDVQNFPTYFASGTARSILSNRVSYFFNWHGPSMTIDTACSSSLVAVHQGVQSLRAGESKVVVVAGTNLLLGPEQYIAESKLKMLSPTGRSRMWDKDADGYARGDGIAVAILKPLSAALADGDHIECIIRESGINQDGRTKGITMPNPVAQADLIRKTYARAGLDLTKVSDRPQYFEAHGTGTPAGDPVEAEAISRAFFGKQANYHRMANQEDPLYVGSIKTVIGHTEGTAGLAAVLKASLALQHGVLPPNLLLKELNPTVKPFYNDLQILNKAKKWPNTLNKTTRRASVNSFGFGGANAHAILESFDAEVEDAIRPDLIAPPLTPFNFSASSERSLAETLGVFSDYIKIHPNVNLRDLSWTLNCRRSTLPVRMSISASNPTDLAAKLKIAAMSPSDFTPASKSSSVRQPKLLGVFTGQGAQWARMGAELLNGSSLGNDCIANLDSALQALPEEHRPQWLIKDEILKDAASSRIGQALFSQTLCTAIQIMVIDLLYSAGVVFTAVVGHSSGEISAAYAAGYLRAEDAIKIAYYRGWSLQYSSDSSGVKGAMLAAGTSLEDAQDLCESPILEGRVCVAASNSSASVTISGDADAIDEMKEIFEDEKKFARLLEVDKAYHSHHMLPCAAPYIAALQGCRIKTLNRANARTTWVSSVYGKDIDNVNDSLADTYWSNNMINPVLFSHAISFAVAALGPFNMAIEVGPHPALKGPALQTIQEVSGTEIPYTGTCSRGKDSIQAFSSSLGALWSSLGEGVVDFAEFDDKIFPGRPRRRLLKGLPMYSWDHDRVYWHESRVSSEYLEGNDRFHPLLGVKCPDGTQKEIRWRNYLHTREISWLPHHQVQGQIVFPAAGYISAALEILVNRFGLDSIKLLDFRDVIIGQALVLEENTGVEVIYALNISEITKTNATASFNCYSDANKGTLGMSLHASAQIKVDLGDPDHEELPPRSDIQGSLLEVETDRFYDFVSQLGFGYTGPFRALSSLRRKMNEATGLIAVPMTDVTKHPFLAHPGSLDAAIQAIMLAYSFPGDGRLRTLYLPTRIDSIRVNPASCMKLARPGSQLPFHSSVASARFSELSGDVDIYSADGRYTVIQLQGLHTTPLTPLSSATDVPMFTEIEWGPEEVAPCDGNSGSPTPEDGALSLDIERVAYFYLKSLSLSLGESDTLEIAPHHGHLLAYADHCASRVTCGDHPYVQLGWNEDTASDISGILNRHPESVDMKIMRVIGEILASVIRGEENILEALMKDNLLSQFYSETLGIQSCLQQAAQIAAQISHRFPHINVLEIGAGSGETTRCILDGMQNAFASYTFTDFWESQFDKAQEKFQEHQSKMTYKVLDIEKEINGQGFSEESFDLVVASLALYATKNLESTLSNVRRLIKPGGYLVLLEVTDPNAMRFGLVLGGLPAWWMGHSEGRTLSPCISAEEWGNLMRKTGFSNIEGFVTSSDKPSTPFSVMVTQAVDQRVNFLHDPLTLALDPLGAESLTIIGGSSSLTTSIVLSVKEAVYRHYGKIKLYCSFADVLLEDLPVMGSVLCVSELDEPVLASMTSQKLKAFQELFKKSKNILWVGYGAQGDNPYGNMITGVQRTLQVEMPHLRAQFMNFHSIDQTNPANIAQRLLQLEASGIWEQKGQLQDVLWYTEPEIMLKNGRVFIPRIKLHSARNDRYNSSKRLIAKEADRNSIVTIHRSDSYYQVLEAEFPVHTPLENGIQIQVRRSLLQPVRINETDQLFLVAGKDLKANRHVVALSRSLDSCIHVPSSRMISCGQSENESHRSILSLYTYFIAQALFEDVLPGNSVAVLEPDFSLAASLTRYASQRGIQIVFLTSKNKICLHPWIYLHRNSSHREISKSIPPNTVRLLNIGGDDNPLSIIRECLPLHCKFETEAKMVMQSPHISSQDTFDEHRVGLTLKEAWATVQSDTCPVNMNRFPSLGLRDLMNSQPQLTRQILVEWETELLQQVLPATKTVKFTNNKTYWLIGLTGGLGLSLCEWMAQQGACYIALSSRNPKVDEKWILEMAAMGCTIRVFANDITDRDSVRNTFDQITVTMPAIAGVAQGAMVLQDTMFLDLDIARLEKVLQPKVQGSILLDELFSKNTLDFMIFFSSMASITGNPGQVAYNAANMFMASLAANRRDRGLAGYAINIGAIVGNGYVTRELNMDQQSYLYRVGHTWMSEQDFREVFAEGVLSCRKGTGSSQLCSSLRIDDDGSKNWVSNPMFQHLVTKSNSLVTPDKKSKAGVMVKTRLLEAESDEEILETLIDVFVPKLRSSLQIDADKPVVDMSPDMLGIDSLNAIDLRSWFLKEIGVDMPVLKIFNSASIRELLEFAATLIPEGLIPNMKKVIEDTPSNILPSAAHYPSQLSTPEPDSPQTGSVSDSTEESKVFHLDYMPSHAGGSGSSATSLKAGYSSSDQNDDVSSASSVDDNMEVPATERGTQRTLPMSYGQSRFYFLKSFIEDKTAFNVTPVFEITGNLRIADFARAVEVVAQRHEALRTYFFTGDDKQPMQGVLSKSTIRLERVLITDKMEVEVAKESMKYHVFDIAAGEVLRIQLLSLRPDKHWLIIGFDHINMDGISFEVFWSDLEQVYNGVTLSQDMLQYPDFTLRQRQDYERGAWDDSIKYWRLEFKDIPPVVPLLSFSRQPIRPNNSKFGSHQAHIRLDREISDGIKQCASMFKVTPYHFHLAVWQFLLLRLFDTDDICIGLGDGNRIDPDVQQSVGLFLNLVPIRFHRKNSHSFGEALKETRLTSQNAFSNAHVPLSIILSELSVPRSTSHSPLFQVSFNYRPGIADSRKFCGCVAEGSLFTTGGISYDLHLDIVDVGGGETSVYLVVQKDLYEKEHAEIILRSYHGLLKAFLQNPATKISWPPLFSHDDIERSLVAGRGPEIQNMWPTTLVHRIDDMSRLCSDRVALKEAGGVELTYSQVSHRVSNIASELLQKAVGSCDIVGIFQSPGVDWICSIMAIWRIGATYLPLDTKVGIDRLCSITSRTSFSCILADDTTVSKVASLGALAKILNVSDILGQGGQSVDNKATATQTAVIMYTSGSTGVPKGMKVSHAEYSNQVYCLSQEWGIREAKETVLHQSSYAWDMSICQILITLSNGGTLIIANSEQRLDPGALAFIIQSEKVTTTLATPTEYLSWFRHGRSQLNESTWTSAISGGEMVSNGLIQEFQSVGRPDLRLINAYGPAEATFACSTCIIPYMDIQRSSADPFVALRTVANNSVYVVDESFNPLPIGMPGELVIGGAGIVKGYLDPEKTTERFMNDQHSSAFFQSQGWSTIHRTGDRARITEDGGLVLMGRISGDTQIKLNGIRINVEEIESAIVQTSKNKVLQAVISPRLSDTDDGQKFIVAFVVVAAIDDGTNPTSFLERLASDLPLPQYMRPAAIIPIDHIPQNTSGKVDRFAVNELPIPQLSKNEKGLEDLAPLEESLRQLWQETFSGYLVSRQALQSTSDYFHSGGSSLSLVSLQSLLKGRLGASVSLPQLFEASTLQGMASLIRASSSSATGVPVDWELEIEGLLDASRTKTLWVEKTHSSSRASVVVLTGATGFIGKEIVRNLLDDENIQAVHCIAVRKPQALLPSIFSAPKVHVYHGNLGAHQLGLSDADVATIFSDADIIIHNGADVSFMRTYQSLKLTNVASTKELVKLSLPRKVPFHFVSSATVTRLAKKETFKEASLASYSPPAIPDDGYMAAKWVCEVYLERASRRFGLPVWIHRPSSVQGTDAPELDLMSNVLQYCQETKKIPDTSSWPGSFDLVTVETVASEIVDAVRLSGSPAGDKGVHFLYESGELELGHEDVQAIMESGTGEQFDVVPVAEWVDLAENAGMSPLLGMFLREAKDGQVLLPKLIKSAR